jgi:hypothetical protein
VKRIGLAVPRSIERSGSRLASGDVGGDALAAV